MPFMYLFGDIDLLFTYLLCVRNHVFIYLLIWLFILYDIAHSPKSMIT